MGLLILEFESNNLLMLRIVAFLETLDLFDLLIDVAFQFRHLDLKGLEEVDLHFKSSETLLESLDFLITSREGVL